MKLGTAQFEGSRLREAREARALTVVALADILDVSRQMIFQYETGIKSPSPEVMDRIVGVLDFPFDFFLRKTPPEKRGVMFYRSMSSATKVARARAERRFGWFRRIVIYLQQFVEFQPVKFLELPDMSDDPSFIDSEFIEKVAMHARRFWGLGDGPISNVAWLLENNGAHLVRNELAAQTLDAFSEWDEDLRRPFIVLGTDKGSAARSRYDAAHELGHMLLHRKISAESLRNKSKFRLVEDQANYFAGAFLLPAKSFTTEFIAPSLDVFHSMKARWKVSIAAMIKRSANLGLISAEQEQRLWINMTRRGWRSCEPLDKTQEPEEPRFLVRAIDMLLEKKIISPIELSANLSLRIRDIEDVCGLRPNDLSDHEVPSIKLNPAHASPLLGWPKSATTGNWILPVVKPPKSEMS